MRRRTRAALVVSIAVLLTVAALFATLGITGSGESEEAAVASEG